jgi:hypothetical protein
VRGQGLLGCFLEMCKITPPAQRDHCRARLMPNLRSTTSVMTSCAVHYSLRQLARRQGGGGAASDREGAHAAAAAADAGLRASQGGGVPALTGGAFVHRVEAATRLKRASLMDSPRQGLIPILCVLFKICARSGRRAPQQSTQGAVPFALYLYPCLTGSRAKGGRRLPLVL